MKDAIEHVDEGKMCRADGIVQVENVEPVETDLEEIARTPMATHKKVSRGAEDTWVHEIVDSDPSGTLWRDVMQRGYRRSISPSTYYKYSVRLSELTRKYSYYM